MSQTFLQGLVISAIGLTMVFTALLLLWALIALLTRLHWPGSDSTSEENPNVLAELQPAEHVVAPSSEELAAIGAVFTLLRAEREAESTLRKRLPPVLTRWVAVGYARQLHPWRPPQNRRRE